MQLAISLKEELAKAERAVPAPSVSFPWWKRANDSACPYGKAEECVTQWRNPAMNRICRQKSRATPFANYSIAVLAPMRGYTMTDRRNAPEDSNQFLEA